MSRIKVTKINLTERTSAHEQLPTDASRLFLGGRGVNIYLLYHNVKAGMDSLSPHAPLIIGPGKLSGIPGPATSRCSISGKSPETGLLGDSNIGGSFGSEMKKTGFGHILITGKAVKPVCLLLENGKASIEDASHLWGKDTFQTEESLKKEYGDCAVLSIGQAGENLARFAAIRSGKKSAAARTGMGCLMGSKNLKAVIAKGGKPVPVNDSRKLADYNRLLREKIRTSAAGRMLAKYGTPFLYDIHNREGIVRTFNGRRSIFPEGKDLRSTHLRRNYYTEKTGCFSCPIACRHLYEVKEGRWKGLTGEGLEYGVLGAIGPVCGITEPASIMAIKELLDGYGIDAASAGNIIAWAIELFQEGIIDKEMTGMELEWGDEDAVLKIIHGIARREGFGGLLADGACEAARKIGKNSEDYLIWVKSLPQSDSVDVRFHKGFALGIATSSRGADHLRSRPTLEALNLSEETLGRIFGGKISPDPRSYEGKARMVWWTENLYALADSLGICKFVIKFNDPDLLGFEEFSTLIKYACGDDISPQELFEAGERITTLERLFIVREGISRKDDCLPQRYFQPMPDGRHKGERIDRSAFDGMLDEYYQLHGWDKNGIPKRETISRLGL